MYRVDRKASVGTRERTHVRARTLHSGNACMNEWVLFPPFFWGYQLPWLMKRRRGLFFFNSSFQRAKEMAQSKPCPAFAPFANARAFLPPNRTWPLTCLSRFDIGLLVKGVSFFFASTKMAETNQPTMADPSKNSSKVSYVLRKRFSFLDSHFGEFWTNI